MNKRLIFRVILSIGALVLLPCIPAIEIENYVETIKEKNHGIFYNKINELFFNTIRLHYKKIENINILKLDSSIISFFYEEYLSQTIRLSKKTIVDSPVGSQCMIFILSIITFLRFCFKIINFIFSVATTLFYVISNLIGRIVTFTLRIIKPLVKLVILLLTLYFLTAAFLDTIFLCVFLILIILGRVT